jgi:hypothetical protein
LGASGYYGQTFAGKKDTTDWLVQAGISKNFFGPGNTTLYGEYGVTADWGAAIGAGRTYSNAAIPGATTVTGVTGTEFTMWGLGITQNVDAAASTLYLTYRNFGADIDCSAACIGGGTRSLDVENLHTITGGAVVRF